MRIGIGIGIGFRRAVGGGAPPALAAGSISLNGTPTQTTLPLRCTAAIGGTGPYTYQWYRSLTTGFVPGAGNILAGKTALTLADTGLTANTTYFYKVVASDSASHVATTAEFSTATLAVLAAGVITPAGSPTPTMIALTSAAATGGLAPYTYQWYRATAAGFTPGVGNLLAGKTSLALADTGLTPATDYYYRLIATDAAAGTATSAETHAVTAAVLTAGVISANGNPSTIAIPLKTTAATGGNPPYTYQWSRSTVSGSGYADIAGATGLTLNDTGLTTATDYYYRCKYTDSVSAVFGVEYHGQTITTPPALAGLTNWWDNRTAPNAYGTGLANWTDKIGLAVATADATAGVSWIRTGSGYAGPCGGMFGNAYVAAAYQHTIHTTIIVRKPYTLIAVGADAVSSDQYEPFPLIAADINGQLTMNCGSGHFAVSAVAGGVFVNTASPAYPLKQSVYVMGMGAGAAGNMKVWLNGADVTQTAKPAADFGQLLFGGFSHTTAHVLIYNRLLSDAEMLALATYFRSPQYNVVCDGSDLMNGSNLAIPYLSRYSAQAGDTLAGNGIDAFVNNWATNGSTTTALAASINTRITPYYLATATANVMVYMETINDVNVSALTPTQARDITMTYGTTLKGGNAGWKGLCVTHPTTTPVNLVPANSAIKALFTVPTSHPRVFGRTSGGTPWEACLFLDQNPSLVNPADPTYFQNPGGVFWTPAGHAAAAADLCAALPIVAAM